MVLDRIYYYFECNPQLHVLFIFDSNHSIFRLDTHCNQTYLCAVTINDNDYGKRETKLSRGVRPLSVVLRDQRPLRVLCGLWSELRQVHELETPPTAELSILK